MFLELFMSDEYKRIMLNVDRGQETATERICSQSFGDIIAVTALSYQRVTRRGVGPKIEVGDYHHP